VLEIGGEALGNRDAAAADADQGQVGKTTIVFEDFVRNSRERTGNALRIHDDRHLHLFADSQVRVKELEAV
jgi:hypothetical protein